MSMDQSLMDVIDREFSGHHFERIMPLKAIKASVLMPLIEKDGELSLLFEVRFAFREAVERREKVLMMLLSGRPRRSCLVLMMILPLQRQCSR